ncbi:MAG: TonB-dependent receptor [Paludibacteraceae bacterium]|nr:TonB-dependent receptor [Paludibacteraceae bacterium]
MKQRIFTIAVLAWMSLAAFAQTLTVTGVVMAQDEPDPVIGANVMVKGSTNGTITDFDGNFSLQAKQGDVLQVSFMGYKTQEVKVSGAGPLRVTLVPDNVQLQEVVAIGYGTMKKSDLTGAVTSVSADQLLKAPVAGLDQALQGRAAGVTVTSGSGQPGEAATIRIRGIGSAIGGNDPLYVVDGVITSDIKFLSPSDIKSMEILKDASATAIYGSRGANGVILITTKSGGEGKVNINFDAYWGFQNRWKKLDLMGAQEFAEMKVRIGAMRNGGAEIAHYYKYGFNDWMYVYNTGDDSYFPSVLTPRNPGGLYDYSLNETDWQDEVFHKNAFMHNYNLSIDGGGEKGHYAFSAGYFSQDGTIIGSNYNRLTLRLNSDFKIRKWLTIGEHLSFVHSAGRNAMNNSSSPGASVISAALAMAPWDPTHYQEGTKNVQGEDLSGRIAASSNFKNVVNPFSMVEESFPNNQNERWVGDLYLEIKPVEGLTIRPSISMDYSLNRNRNFKNQYEYSSFDKMNLNFIESNMTRYMSLLEETTITYARQIGKHNFSVMAGQTWQEWNQYGLAGSGSGILNPVESNWYVSRATEKLGYSSDNVARIRRMSFLGRVFYSYDSRYMITANFRADASSKFTKNPWGFFPSVALAWRLSEEHFIKDKELDWLDNIKIRAGWGQVGNDGIGSGSFVQSIFSANTVFTGYPLGGLLDEAAYGAAVLTLVNQSGKWETNQQWDAGIDFSFWNGKLSGTVDYFRRDTKDALLYVNAPAHVGNRYSLTKNVGNIRNEGVEITLNHDNTVGRVHYNIGGNISFISNKLTDLNGGSPLWGDRTKTDVGMPLNSFWGYEYEGVYKSDAEVLEQFYGYKDNAEANLHAGDARYKNLNGNGFLDEGDKRNIGNPFPKLTYGINLGADFYGVDIQLFFQGVYGNSIYNALRLRTEGAGTECAMSTSMRDVWIGYTDQAKSSMIDKGLNYMTMNLENLNGSIPNPVGSTLNTENSTRFIEDGSYLRLKNLQIGYTFPLKWTQKFRCSRLRLYATASNLFTITKYSGYDPEVGSGVDYGNYPQSRTFTFGLNATF